MKPAPVRRRYRPRSLRADEEITPRTDSAGSSARRPRKEGGVVAKIAEGLALVQLLSIVLPVHNVQPTLARQLAELLDVLADLTTRFEVVLVDDGSTDHTEETALELAVRYPQLRVVRIPQRSGAAAAVERGLEAAEGDVAMVIDGRAPLRPGDLRRLWEMRNEEELISARAATPPHIEPRLMKQLSSWGAAVKRLAEEHDRTGGVQMIRRGAVRELAQSEAADVSVSDIRRTDRIRRRTSHTRGPTFLAHLKELTLGE
ncbi:MAG: glycosyltransferase family 2 protein [Planctomycetes bacterium]|nr:glycosyltransferase family 2 protein [Planctomycetota bacterium]